MKLKKLQAAFKKAQATEKVARAAYTKVVARDEMIAKAWEQAKAVSKAARKELKRTRKQAVLSRAARESVRRSYDKTAADLAKLTRKLKKAEKRIFAKAVNRKAPVPAKARVPAAAARKAKPTRTPNGRARPVRPNMTVPITSDSSFPENAAAQA